MVAYLWSGEYESKPLNEQLVASVARVYPQNNGEGFWQQLRHQFSELKDKFKDSGIKTRQTGDNWTAFGVFQRPGLQVSVNTDKHYYSGPNTQPDIYGYRMGTEEEALAAGLSQTANRVPSHVLAAGRLTKSDKKELSNISQDTKTLQNQTDRIAVQFRIEQEKNAKLAADLAKVQDQLAQMSSPSAASLATENIASTIFITGCSLSLDWTEIPSDKIESVNEILEAYAGNAAEDKITRNRSKQITELTLPNAHLVGKLKDKLVKALGLTNK